MRKLSPLCLLLLVLLFSSGTFNWCFSQNVGINGNGTAPNSSALLDVDATGMSPKKGILIPRLTTSERNAISPAATGLLIYNSDCNIFNYYNGTSWVDMLGNVSTGTPPAAPTATAASGVGSSQFTANWNTIGGATSYILDVSTDSNFVTGFVVTGLNVGDMLNHNVTGLTVSTYYYYRVRAVNNCGVGTNSNTISAFTVSTLPNGLISYWSFDETGGDTYDEVGNDNLSNNNGVTYTTGLIGNAATFDGATQFFSSGLSDLGSQTAFTFSTWFNLSSSQLGGNVIGAWDVSPSHIFVMRADVTEAVAARGSAGGNAETDYYTTFSTGTWYHYVVTMAINNGNATVNVYINGSLVGTSTSSGTENGSKTMYIGSDSYAGSNGGFFPGSIDEVGYWNRVLTTDEITALYNNGHGLAYPF